MGLEKQGSKPKGFIGKIIGRMMNKFHTSLYIDYFKNNLPNSDSKILDIGCGGGKFLNFLHDSNKTYLLCGIDHSPEMIELAAKINKGAMELNKLKLIQTSVTNIGLENSYFNLITAFETVQFWPDIDRSFKEVYRLLMAGGQFLIINRYPPMGTKWWKIAKIKSDKEFIYKLENAGFGQINVDLNFKTGWILVKTTKQQTKSE